MSYCRWSSDDFQCDLYVYESADGYTTHVASHRIAFAKPLPPEVPWSADNAEAFVRRHNDVLALVRDSPHEKIGLPHDGATFQDASPGDCAHRLETLRALGYRVPQGAIDALWAEERGE